MFPFCFCLCVCVYVLLTPMLLLPAAIIGKISICPFLPLCKNHGAVRCHGQTGPRIKDSSPEAADKRDRRRICHLSLWHSWWMCLTCGSGHAPQSLAFARWRCLYIVFHPFSDLQTARPPWSSIVSANSLPHRMTLHTLRRERPVNNVRRKCRLSMVEILMANCWDVAIYLVYISNYTAHKWNNYALYL